MRWPPASSVSSTTDAPAGSHAGAGAAGRAAKNSPKRKPASGSRRSIHQLASPAATAEVTPISRIATTATCQPDGPTSASRPLPSGPPDRTASSPTAAPAAAPEAKPQAGAASSVGVGMTRTVSTPPATAARYGTASTSRDSQAGTCPDGSAASMGNAGSEPRAAPVGATTVPAPKAKPGPRQKAIPQTTALGT